VSDVGAVEPVIGVGVYGCFRLVNLGLSVMGFSSILHFPCNKIASSDHLQIPDVHSFLNTSHAVIMDARV
jgi:hypothetical protein